MAGQDVLHRHAERMGDAREIGPDLAGATGFPLGDGAARDTDRAREVFLRQIHGEPGFADAGADSSLCFEFHAALICNFH